MPNTTVPKTCTRMYHQAWFALLCRIETAAYTRGRKPSWALLVCWCVSKAISLPVFASQGLISPAFLIDFTPFPTFVYTTFSAEKRYIPVWAGSGQQCNIKDASCRWIPEKKTKTPEPPLWSWISPYFLGLKDGQYVQDTRQSHRHLLDGMYFKQWGLSQSEKMKCDLDKTSFGWHLCPPALYKSIASIWSLTFSGKNRKAERKLDVLHIKKINETLQKDRTFGLQL